ncbi:response regulator transcription factor [Tabrizicola caldifontis]|uniref:response regulator transcription factor n=1 Tax=Tabrizicola caldifontis TaxID=2528036 RepID=UPI001F0FDF1F|nr:response regulator transcription factor [Rhodobacter sp. YIM 73028]
MSDRILIVEDDAETAAAVRRSGTPRLRRRPLRHAGGRDRRRIYPYKVIVLDRMLPGGDGVEAMAQIRAGGSQALILSALGRAANRVEGLEKGADDYLAKPFEPDELRARLRALLRRATMQVQDNDLLAFGDLEIRLKARTVHVRRVHVAVSPKEFELITFLARHAGQVVTRMQLLENVWNLHFDPDTNVVDVHVGRLRRKLEEARSDAMRDAAAGRSDGAGSGGAVSGRDGAAVPPCRSPADGGAAWSSIGRS